MRSESVSGFFHSLANFPTPHMSGSWLPCLILSQNPHSLPKLISNKYTDVLTNPLHAPMMRAHVMWTFLIWAGWPIFHFSVLEEFTVSVSTCIRAGNVDQQLQVCKISCLSFCTSFLFYHSNAVCLQDVAMLQVFFFFFCQNKSSIHRIRGENVILRVADVQLLSFGSHSLGQSRWKSPLYCIPCSQTNLSQCWRLFSVQVQRPAMWSKLQGRCLHS